MTKSCDPPENVERISAILSGVERMAGGDLASPIPRSGRRDELDAIATGINILGAELRYTTVSKQYMDSIVDALVDPLIGVDVAGTIETCNPAAYGMLGHDDGMLIGRPLGVVVITPGGDALAACLRWVSSEWRPWRGEGELRATSGERIPVALTVSPLDPERYESRRLLCVARDLRETHRLMAQRYALEAQLRTAQKMESLGRMAGGIAHDFNNLLTAVISYAEFLEAAFDADDPRYDDATGILTSAERAERMIRQLLAFARRQPQQPQAVVVDELIRDTRDMFARLVGEDVEIVTRLAGGAGAVRIDRGQLAQVLINLVVNARHAMVDGGTLVIATTRRVFDGEAVRTRPGIQPGAYLGIKVVDNGVGMSEEIRTHAFEPFFTTRERGEGSGLGLATCYGIVTQAGGSIELDSTPGRGTALRIYLPQTTTTAAHADRSGGSEANGSVGGGGSLASPRHLRWSAG